MSKPFDPAASNSTDRERFLLTHGFTQQQFDEANLTWDALDSIRVDHQSMAAELSNAGESVVKTLQSVAEVHSLRARVKDPDHLLAKIIRKKKKCSIKNYAAQITDLAGVRVLHLFKHQWLEIHKFVTGKWKLQEKPIAYVRKGDSDDEFKKAGCKVMPHPQGYRSVHYLLKTHSGRKLNIVELQVRTIFEEGWSEIDHTLRYPRGSSGLVSELLAILNRLAGAADEMGALAKSLTEYVVRQDNQSIETGETIERLREEVAATSQAYEKAKADVRKAVAALKISKADKDRLQEQLESLAKTADQSNSAITALDLLRPPSASNVPKLAYTDKWGSAPFQEAIEKVFRAQATLNADAHAAIERINAAFQPMASPSRISVLDEMIAPSELARGVPAMCPACGRNRTRLNLSNTCLICGPKPTVNA